MIQTSEVVQDVALTAGTVATIVVEDVDVVEVILYTGAFTSFA